MIDVVIPARNEQNTIGKIVDTFHSCPEIGAVVVSVDMDTTDNTRLAAFGYSNIKTDIIINLPECRGKGQCVKRALDFVKSDNVIFCDADYTGLTTGHITQLIRGEIHDPEMAIGVPDFPPPPVLPRIIRSWQWVSGFRIMPTALARSIDLHGYLMEVQINAAANIAKLPLRFERMYGLKSPLNLTNKRLVEMERDRLWGIANHIF